MKKIVLLHGALGCKKDFDQLSLLLKEKSFSVYTLDFSGHGSRKNVPDKFSIHLFANDAIKEINKHKVERINIFGYSMGGYVGMYLAKYFPHMVENLITLGTKFRWNPSVSKQFCEMIELQKLKKNSTVWKKLVAKHGKKTETLIQRLHQFFIEMGTDAPLKLEEFLSIESKTLILKGDKDDVITEEECRNVKEHIIQSEYKVIPNTSHAWEAVDIKHLSEIIEEFIVNKN